MRIYAWYATKNAIEVARMFLAMQEIQDCAGSAV